MENLYLNQNFLSRLDLRQNVLVKNMLGIRHISRTRPLFNELKIESIKQLYFKHKVFGLKQMRHDDLSNDILLYLEKYYNGMTPTKQSFISQLNKTRDFAGCELGSIKNLLNSIDGKFMCNDQEMRSNISCILDNFNFFNSFFYMKLLNDILYVIF